MASIFSPRTDRQVPTGILLAIACVAQFMVVLDVSVVNVALPSIGRDLHYSATGLQWVVNAYVLTFAGFLLLGGRAADLFGRRRVFLFGLGLFVGASLLGGLAQSSAQLTAARALQGLGGAVLSPATLTIIVTTYPREKVTRALGVWSAMAAGGGAAGSVLGGVLTSELSWRWVLFINVPIGLALGVAAYAFLADARLPTPPKRLDVAGAITVTAGLAALVYAIVNTDTHPWGSAETLGVLAVAVILLGAFFVLELRVASEPLMPMRLFRLRSVTGSNLVMLPIGAAFFSMWYFLSLYLQNVLHYSPLRAGLAFLPMALTIIVGAQLSARLVSRIGVRSMLVIGTIVATAGYVWLSRIGPDSTYWSAVFGAGCLTSFSLGLLFTPLARGATADVAPQEAGLASGLLNTSRQVGGSIGLAALATVATDHTKSLLAGGQSTPAASLTAGYARAFEVAAILTALGCLAAFLVPRTIGKLDLPVARPATADGGAAEPDAAVSTASAASDGDRPAATEAVERGDLGFESA
ncbi:MAG TPA: MFS transporter [Acidimicrobiales bacterium]|nr:MFS transporter [Acidimicrobiales bacterium]